MEISQSWIIVSIFISVPGSKVLVHIKLSFSNSTAVLLMLKYFTTSLDAHLAGQPSKETEVDIYKIIAMFSKIFYKD